MTLQRGNETLRYTLIDERAVPRDPSELLPTDALAQKLISHHKGDQIVWERGLADLTYEVIDVQSKYVAAFQETLKEFAPRFPDNHALHRVEVPENDPSGIRLRRDNWVSVRYAEALNSGKSSVTLQRTDRHGILDQKRADFQESL